MGARVIGLASACLGAVALVVALLVAAGSPAPVPELPLEAGYEAVVEGAGVAYLDPRTLEERSGQDVSIAVRVRGDADAADEGTAVRTYDTTTSAADGTLIATATATVCLDRRSAVAVDCASGSVDGRRTDVRGLTLAFPPGGSGKDRMLWDGTVHASFPVRFAGTERLRGLEVQRYVQVVPEQVLRPVTVPGPLLASPEPWAQGEVIHGAHRALLVEPGSGVVVATEEILMTRVVAPDGTPGAVLLGGAFASTEESVSAAVARAREALDRRDAPGAVLPWVLGGAGVFLLGLGGLFVRAGTRVLPVEPEPERALRAPVPVG